jgi:hypothetical protein
VSGRQRGKTRPLPRTKGNGLPQPEVQHPRSRWVLPPAPGAWAPPQRGRRRRRRRKRCRSLLRVPRRCSGIPWRCRRLSCVFKSVLRLLVHVKRVADLEGSRGQLPGRKTVDFGPEGVPLRLGRLRFYLTGLHVVKKAPKKVSEASSRTQGVWRRPDHRRHPARPWPLHAREKSTSPPSAERVRSTDLWTRLWRTPLKGGWAGVGGAAAPLACGARAIKHPTRAAGGCLLGSYHPSPPDQTVHKRCIKAPESPGRAAARRTDRTQAHSARAGGQRAAMNPPPSRSGVGMCFEGTQLHLGARGLWMRSRRRVAAVCALCAAAACSCCCHTARPTALPFRTIPYPAQMPSRASPQRQPPPSLA